VYVNSLYKNPFEHSTGDVIDKIDFELLEKVSRGVLACLTELAKANLSGSERQVGDYAQNRGAE
jgi:hypothetical protein